MKRDEADGSPIITQAGFQFLLLDTASQVTRLALFTSDIFSFTYLQNDVFFFKHHLNSPNNCNGSANHSPPIVSRVVHVFSVLPQVWYFILQYLDTIEARGLDLVECLTFLFQLNFSTLGKDYSTEGMSEGLLTFLQHLREFGLVYQRKRKAGR